jgi:hypothetical protein
MASKGIDNAQAIVGIILTLLPWVLRIFGIDIPDIQGGSELSSELAMSVTGTGILAKSQPVGKA